jgi:hypothetical protein
MIIPNSPQNLVNFDLMNIDQLSIMNFSRTPNLAKIFSLRNIISSSESTFFHSTTSWHFVKQSAAVRIYKWPFLDVGFIGLITSIPH